MKMICLMLMVAVLLCGCQAATTFETLEDVYYGQEENAPMQIAVSLPQGTTLIRNGNSRLYLCDGYDIAVEVMAAGDLDLTIRWLTGFSSDALTMVQTSASEMIRYECVWTSAGEDADQVGRAVILALRAMHFRLSSTAAELVP